MKELTISKSLKIRRFFKTSIQGPMYKKIFTRKHCVWPQCPLLDSVTQHSSGFCFCLRFDFASGNEQWLALAKNDPDTDIRRLFTHCAILVVEVCARSEHVYAKVRSA